MKIIISILSVIFIAGCVTAGLDTAEKRHLAARTELNLLLEQYINIQDDIPDATHAKAVDAFNAADAILDTWEVAMANDQGYDYTDDYAVWRQARMSLLRILELAFE